MDEASADSCKTQELLELLMINRPGSFYHSPDLFRFWSHLSTFNNVYQECYRMAIELTFFSPYSLFSSRSWSLHLLLVLAWVFFGYSGFLPQSKNMYVWLIGDSKLPVMIACVYIQVFLTKEIFDPNGTNLVK